MKNLEEYIKDHRPEFDQLYAFDQNQVWQKLEKKRNRNYRKRISIAAGILIIVCAAVWVLTKSNYANGSNENMVFTQLASEYDPVIQQRWNNLDPQKIDQLIWSEIKSELEMLDSMKVQLEMDYTTSLEKERMLQLLRRYYERKLRIIDILEKEMQKFENYKTKLDES